MTKKEKFDFLKRKYETHKNEITSIYEVSGWLGKLAEFDVDWFADEWIRVLKEYRNEISTNKDAAHNIIMHVLYEAENAFRGSTCLDCRRWKPLCDKLKEDGTALEIIFSLSCDGLHGNKLFGCYVEQGDADTVDEVLGYIFSNPHFDNAFKSYDILYYYGTPFSPNKKAVSDVIEKHIKAIEDELIRDKCLERFMDSNQCYYDEED